MPRCLRPLKGHRKIKFATFDIEATNWINAYAVGFYDGHYHEFLGKDCITKFMDFILTKNYRWYKIFGHYAGKYDFGFIADDLKFRNSNPDMRHVEWEMIPLGNGSMLKIILNLNKKDRLFLQDSYALLPKSLDVLTKDFNVMHSKQNFMPDGKENDYDYLHKLYQDNDPLFHKYLKNDCIGLWEVLNIFYHQVPYSGNTIASSALNTWRHMHLKHTIPLCSTELNDKMKEGYFGGRTEIYRMHLPDAKYYCFDVNSLYPYVMHDNEFPICKPVIETSPIKDCYLDGQGITKAKIVAPKMYLPVLPVKYDHKLYFPIGKFEGVWDNSLLVKAKELGYKIEPIMSYHFPETAKIYTEFVDDFYTKKRQALKDTAPYLIAKLIMNSLYGKGAQREISRKIEYWMPNTPLPENCVDFFDEDYNLIITESKSKGTHFIPQTSLHVTALAQLELYKWMETILDKDGILAYCDTDSVFTDVRLPVSEDLGSMSLEYAFDAGYFLLPKTYYIKNNGKKEVKAKGYPYKDFAKNLTEKDFINALFYGDVDAFIYQSEPMFNTLKKGYKQNKTFLSTGIKKRSIQSSYDKRRILPDLNTEAYRMRDIVT